MSDQFTRGLRPQLERVHWTGVIAARTVIDAPVDDQHLSGGMGKPGSRGNFKAGGRHGQ